MPNLTPKQKLGIRRSLEPVALEYDRDVSDLLDVFVAKYEDFKGLVDYDIIVRIIEAECKEIYKPKEPEPDITLEELEVPLEVPVQLDLTGHQVDENIKNKKRSVRMDSSFFDELEAFPPFLSVKNGVTFTLEIVDPTKKPRKHKSKKFDREEVLWDVKLIDISPKETLTKVDDKERPIYQIGKIYSFSMGKSCSKKFKLFQIENEFQATRFKYKRIGSNFQTDYIFMAI